jgi:sulfotransferase famil protein
MICHRSKIIFIHIPKCAGSSIRDFYFDDPKLDWKTPNYELLYGWCPKRRLNLQHATPKQLIEGNLITEKNWNEYFKFSFVRNPWDRAYSDYKWIKKDSCIKGTFKEYILKTGEFDKIFNDNSIKTYRGDHLLQQIEFVNDDYLLDFVGKFENLHNDITKINNHIGFNKVFDKHEKKNRKRFKHYSLFYTDTKKKLVEHKFKNDIENFGYHFEDLRKGINKLKKYL